MINHGDISSEIGNMTKTRLKRVYREGDSECSKRK